MTFDLDEPRAGSRVDIPAPTRPIVEDRPRARPRFSVEHIVDFACAAAAGIAFTLALRFLLDWHGIMGSVLWAYVVFLAVFYLLNRDRESPEIAGDRMMTTLIWSAGAVVVGVIGWMLSFLVIRGAKALRPGFLVNDMSTVSALDKGGGVKHAIIGTLEQVGIATVVVVPLAMLTAIYLHEIRGRLSKPIRFIIDAMSGLPSIVAGLLVYTVYVGRFGFSGFAASLALIVLMLPTIARTSEEVLRTVPDTLREGSLALGSPRWRLVMQVVLPTAQAGLLTAIILGIARGVGETAPAVLTAFGSSTTNTNPFSGPQSSLPLFVWELIRQPNKVQLDRAWAGALVLVTMVLVLFTLARFVGSHGERKLGRRR